MDIKKKLCTTNFSEIHPKVTKTLQPSAYYENYDESICLPEHYLKSHLPKEKAKAAFVILVRNSEQEDIAKSIINLEDKFNKNFHYPYVFLNDQPFTEEFKAAMAKASPNARKEFGLLILLIGDILVGSIKLMQQNVVNG
ncbi:unnamed protein product [Cunninghamella echinulata]